MKPLHPLDLRRYSQPSFAVNVRPPNATMPSGSEVPVPARPPSMPAPGTMIPVSMIPILRQNWVSGWSEPPNLSSSATVQTLQMAIRTAEGGDTRQLFALYRDLTAGGSHIQTEFFKRKGATIAQPHSILPQDKNNPDDVIAAEACRRMINDCQNWLPGLSALLDSCLYPVSVVEKLFRPADQDRPIICQDKLTKQNKNIQLRFTLKMLSPVNYVLLCFKLPYLSPSFVTPNSLVREDSVPEDLRQIPATLDYYPDAWEPDLRFYNTYQNGYVDLSWARIYPPDPLRHIVHRGHLLTNVRDNYGGPMRAVAPWWLLAGLGRDWFARAMERYGSPFLLGHTDAEDPAKVAFLQEQFTVATKLFGLVVDNDTQVELKECAVRDTADAHDKFIAICNREISKLIVGQELSSTAAATGMGSGVADLQNNVREDLRMQDQLLLGETIQRQLFQPFLQINGLVGAPPRIVWGGLSEQDAALLATTLESFKNAGLEPDDAALETVSDRFGMTMRRVAATAAPQSGDEDSNLLRDGNSNAGPKAGEIEHRNADANPEAPDGDGPAAFSARHIPPAGDAVDEIAAKHAAEVGAALRSDFAGAISLIRNSKSPVEAEAQLKAFFADWRPSKIVDALQPALQKCAAAGAAEASHKV